MTPALAQAELVKLLDLDLDSFHGTSTTNQQYMNALHEGTRRVFRWAKYEYATVAWTPESGDQQFVLKDGAVPTATDFGACLDTVKWARYDDALILDYSAPDFEVYFPSWRTATSGTPVGWTLHPGNLLVLDKPLSAGAISTGGFSVAGEGHPNVVDASNSTVYSTNEWAVESAAPDLAWPCLYEAANFLGTPIAAGPSAVNRLQEYRALAVDGARTYRDEAQRRKAPTPADSAPALGGAFRF